MDDEENGRPLTGRAGVPNGTEPDKQSRAEPLIPVAWQPIETAPKDYTEILCFDPSQGVGIVNFEPRAVEPFWNADVCDLMPGGFAWHPTHWQPLPAPPA